MSKKARIPRVFFTEHQEQDSPTRKVLVFERHGYAISLDDSAT